MSMRLLRMLIPAGFFYVYIMIGHPGGGTFIYHAMIGPVTFSALVATTFMSSVFREGSRKFAFFAEATLLLLVCAFIAGTYPVRGGRPPLLRAFSGQVPRRSDAALGLKHLGVEPGSPAGRAVLCLYPRG